MSPVIDNLDLYWSGFLTSLEFIVYSLIGSMILGTVIAAFRVSPIAALRSFGSAYVTVVRNCPLTIVLFFMAFGLPELGINRSYFFFGIGGDLYSVGKTLTSARGFEYIPVLTGVAIGYLIITLSAGLALGLLERKVAIAR